MTEKRRKSSESFAVYSLKLGFFLIASSEGALTQIRRLPAEPQDFGTRTPLTDLAADELSEYLEGRRREFTFRMNPAGTDFQKKVWQALCTIPYGETRSYRELAELAGSPRAWRAAGSANNRNPLMIAVPCHRVIASDGTLSGYAGGLEMKRTLLELEKTKKDRL